MIAATIVCVSLLFALVYTLAYFLKPGLRDQIESPKYTFQEQIRQYNRQDDNANSDDASTTNE